jgi:hypothetical protein
MGINDIHHAQLGYPHAAQLMTDDLLDGADDG